VQLEQWRTETILHEHLENLGAVGTPSAQDVSNGEVLRSAAGFEGHQQICWAFFNGLYLSAVLNLNVN
jgi:hypothetical protein